MEKSETVKYAVFMQDLRPDHPGYRPPSADRTIGYLRVVSAADYDALVAQLRGLLEENERLRKEPVDPDDERANLVWDLVVKSCARAWKDKSKFYYNECPTELITDIINERDEALQSLATAREEAYEKCRRIAAEHIYGDTSNIARSILYAIAESKRALKPTTEAGGGETK